MLKTHVKYITKTAGNDCAMMRCGPTEKKTQCNGEENRKKGERRKQLYRD